MAHRVRDGQAMRDYALRPEASRGRRYPESKHPYRNDYQRDRDRIVHSRAFRRLEDKTQVFTTRYSDHFRNRLTHTIEVAQVSRTIAGYMGLNEDLVSTGTGPRHRPSTIWAFRRAHPRPTNAKVRRAVRPQSPRTPHR
jgi:dGTP triphosphohydrolase